MLGLLIIGMLVAYNDERLLRTDATAHASPFVIAIDNAGVRGLPHVINAAIFTSAFSAGNSFLYCASRILYGLSLRGQAPKLFSYCTKSGLPLFAVIAAVRVSSPVVCTHTGLMKFSVFACASVVHERERELGPGIRVSKI